MSFKLLHDLQCPKCGLVFEVFLGPDEGDVEVPCEGCGKKLTRKQHKCYGHPPYVVGCKRTDKDR